jgi:Flp pilus assembly pilin Flp
MYYGLSPRVARAFTFSLQDPRREDGQTTVEYAIVVALVIAMAVTVFAVLSGSFGGFLTNAGNYISNQLP